MKRYWVAVFNGRVWGKPCNYREMMEMKAYIKNLEWREVIER